MYIYIIIEGSLEVKLPTIWTDEKQRWAEAERKRADQRRERVRRKKMQMHEKVGKSRNTAFFQWFVAPEGRKVGSLKRRVRSHLARWAMKRHTPLWREAHFEVKMCKTHHSRTTFWKLRCRKSARRCGAKHISKSKCTKHTILGPLLEVEMSKKCTPLRREAHFEVKMYKTHHSWTTFGSWDVEKVHAVVARSTFRSQNVQNTPFSDHFWKLRCRKSARRCGAKHISKSKCTKHTILGPLLEVAMSKKPLWREAHFKVKLYKTHPVRTTFGHSDLVSRGRRKGLCTLSKVSQTWRFCSIPKKMAGMGHLKRIRKDAFSVAGALQKTCSSEMLGGQGADFLRGVAFCQDDFAWQVQHFVWPGITFSWQAQYFRHIVFGSALCKLWNTT